MAVEVQNTTAVAYTYMPDQMLPEWKDSDYIANIRFIASQWNFNVLATNQWSLDLKELGLPLGFAQRAFVWRDYYFGNARNTAYDYTLLKEDGARKMLKMFQGKDIMKFVNYSLEPIMDMAARIPKIINVECCSPDVVSRKRFFQDLNKFTLDQVNFTQYLGKQYSAYFQTPNGTKYMGNAQQQMGSEDFREGIESAAVNVAKDIYYRNNMRELIIDLGKDAFISGVCMTRSEIINGYTCTRRVPIWEAIFPANTQGDQHRTDPFGGQMRFMTVPEIFATYQDLTPEQRTEIQKMSVSDSYGGDFNWNYYNNTVGCPNFYWWGNMSGIPRIAVCDAQWASYEADASGHYRQTRRQGVLIGNRYLLRQGISKNQPHDWRNPSDTNLDFQLCQPMSIFGRNMGIPEMLYTYQNEVDFLQTRINEWVAQTKGNFYLLYASKLTPGLDANQLMSEISDTRIAVIKDVDIDAGQIEKFLQDGAIELPKDTIALIQQIANYKQTMADILNIPDAARGQIQGYQATKTLNTQLSQSNKGTRYFYDPLNIYFQRIFQKGVDLFKTSTMDNTDFEYQLIIGDTQTELFKSTKEFGLSQYALTLGFDDLMDDVSKQRMADTLLAYAQNSQVTGYYLSDYYALESMTTKTEINNFLQFRERQIEDKRVKEQMAAQQAQMAQTEAINQSQKEITAMNNEGTDRREAAKIESKETIEGAKIESKEDIENNKIKADLLMESLSNKDGRG